MDSIKSQLVDMGFHETKIKRAIDSCPEAKTLEQVMEWLIAHEDELNRGEPSKTPANNPTHSAQSGSSTSQPVPSASKPKAEPQNDDFRPEESAAETAARRKITVEEAQRLIAQRLAIRAEEERKKAIEDEKKRRIEGQKLTQTRAQLEDQERIRLAQQIRREKLELEQHKKKILAQIAFDRENMKNRSKMSESPVKSSSSTTSSASKAPPRAPGTECKLALRFPDGSSKVQKFSPQEQLAAVRLFVQMEKTYAQSTSIEFIAPPNRKLTESQMTETLESLGLCPASRLEVKYNRSELVDLD